MEWLTIDKAGANISKTTRWHSFTAILAKYDLKLIEMWAEEEGKYYSLFDEIFLSFNTITKLNFTFSYLLQIKSTSIC